MPAPTNSDDVIDSRDVIARIDELEDELETLMERQRDLDDAIVEAAAQDQDTAALWVQRDRVHQELKDWHDSNSQELKALRALAAEAEDERGTARLERLEGRLNAMLDHARLHAHPTVGELHKRCAPMEDPARVKLGGDPRGPCARLIVPELQGDGFGDGFAIY